MGMSAEQLCDPRRNSRDESIRAARRNAEDRSSYDVEIARHLAHQLGVSAVDVDVVERTLEVLAAVAPAPRLHGVIRTAIAHGDPRVRSKAAVVLGSRVADLPLLHRLIADPDHRVRANTLEALWHIRCAGIEDLFLRCLNDSHRRAVANAAYGLYLIDEAKHFGKIIALIEHSQAEYRAAGAWLLGKIGNPNHLRMLRPLLQEKNAEVRSAAFHTLKTLRTKAPKSES
jgi:HEAT repeat protein